MLLLFRLRMENDHCQKVRTVSKIIANSNNQFKRKFIINPFQGAHVRFDVENLGASNSKCNSFTEPSLNSINHFYISTNILFLLYTTKIWNAQSFHVFRFHKFILWQKCSTYLNSVPHSAFSWAMISKFRRKSFNNLVLYD